MKSRPQIVLASASPRRRDLLKNFFKLRVLPAHCDESRLANESPKRYVRRVAKEKWKAIAAKLNRPHLVVSADTTVVLKTGILGKPQNQKMARKMLMRLSKNSHQVFTAVAVGWSHKHHPQIQFLISTSVRFREISENELAVYLKSGEWKGKAGAYAVQGRAASFVADIRGSLSNVIGLPVEETVLAIYKTLSGKK